jgi:AcrR family transcriptional regulator
MQERAQKRRERLIRRAAQRIHRHGYHRTTLADIAKSARVPAGGIYYYFKNKDSLIHAIIEMRMNELNNRLDSWNDLPDPKAKLRALVNVWRDDSEVDARYGCPLGSLCSELAKAGGAAARVAARPLERIREWSEQQFRDNGNRDAAGLAEHLVMTLQGASLVANATRDPKALIRETDRLKTWIDTL